MQGQSSDGIYMVQYEDIPENSDLIKNILKFLGIASDPQRLSCLESNSEGKFHRKKGSKQACNSETSEHFMPDIFTAEQKELVDSAIDRLSELVKRHLSIQEVDLKKYKSTVVDFCWRMIGDIDFDITHVTCHVTIVIYIISKLWFH